MLIILLPYTVIALLLARILLINLSHAGLEPAVLRLSPAANRYSRFRR
jgi:hypothetical protein